MEAAGVGEVNYIPDRLLVIGGGYIGLELGQVDAGLGSRVSLVEMTESLLPGVDHDLVQPLARRVEKLFETVRLNARVTALSEKGSGIQTAGGRRRAETPPPAPP